MAEEG